MVNWIILAVLILLLLLFFKTKRMQHKVFAILMILLLVFFYVTASNIVSKNKIDIKTFDGIVMAGKLYFNWLGHAIKNIKTIGGNAIKMDWGGNSTGT